LTQLETRKPTLAKPVSSLAEIIQLIPGYDPVKTAEDSWFDEKAAQFKIDFIENCCIHIEGKLAWKPFLLEDWEKAIVANLFGWKRFNDDGVEIRRYRECLIYVPRKNGKTPLLAAIGNAVFFTEDEAGQQNYCAAAEVEQAALVYRHMTGMIDAEPEMNSRCTIYKASKRIVKEADQSFVKVLSKEAKTKHGGNPHLIMVDELHTQPNRDLVDVLTTSMASENRLEPLIIYITTSDFNQPSICNIVHDMACKVRDGVKKDSAFLPVIYEAAITDDWKDPKVWADVNPNLGISVSLAYIKRMCKKAQDEPSFENTFKRLHLNIKTEQDIRWLQMEVWESCNAPVDKNALKGLACWAGLDLSSTSDLTSFALVFRPIDDDGIYRVLLWTWVPGESMEKRYRQDKVPYPTWVRQGFIEETSGNVVDYRRVRQKINEIAKDYSIQEIAFDPYNATQISTELGEEDGFNMVEFRQGDKTMNEPMKNFERLILSGKFAHGGNPVLKWAASNVSIKEGPTGNIKPDKKKSTEKIDPVVATVMGLGRAMFGEVSGSSSYDNYDLEKENDFVEFD